MGFPSYVELNWGDEKKENTAEVLGLLLGTRGITPDGRVFRYAKAGEALGAGKLCQDPLAIANHDMDLVLQAAAAIGDKTIAVTLGATLASLDQYKDGKIGVNDGPGEGHIYRIKSNPAAVSGATLVLTLEDGETVREALTTAASLLGLEPNAYNGTLLYNTSPDGIPTGVAPIEVTNAYYHWLQTWGDCMLLINGTVVLGKMVVPGLTTSGSVDVHISTGDQSMNIGVVKSPIAVSTDYARIFLTIAP